MGILYRYDPTAGVRIVVWDGTVTVQQWHEHLRRAVHDPAWSRGSKVVVDLTGASPDTALADVDVDAGSAIVREHLPNRRGQRIAIIGPRGFAQAASVSDALLGDGVRALSFTDVPSACTWLEIDANTVARHITELRRELRA